MSRADRIQKDLIRAARRARRLAERAEQRASRRADRAGKAAARAEELALRVSRRARRHSRDVERNIEDMVDQVTERWSGKAEQWIDDVTDHLSDEAGGYRQSRRRSKTGDDRASVRRRRRSTAGGTEQVADKAEEVAEDLNETMPGSENSANRQEPKRDKPKKDKHSAHRTAEEAGPEMSESEREYRRRKRRAARRNQRAARKSQRSASKRMHYRKGLYRDPDRAKVCGVCAGFADYFDVEVWQVRLGAILGLVFIGQLTITGYFIAYFLMEKKPYYRRVTDRYDREERQWDSPDDTEKEDQFGVNDDYAQADKNVRQPRMSNALALRTARSKFTEMEDRVRSMESHVTSSKFELQRELKKLSGEN